MLKKYLNKRIKWTRKILEHFGLDDPENAANCHIIDKSDVFWYLKSTGSAIGWANTEEKLRSSPSLSEIGRGWNSNMYCYYRRDDFVLTGNENTYTIWMVKKERKAFLSVSCHFCGGQLKVKPDGQCS